MAKPVKGHHFQRYKHLARWFPYYFPIISLVVPYDFPMFPLLFPIISLFFPIVPGETWRNHILSVENLLNISKLKKLTGAEIFDDVFASF